MPGLFLYLDAIITLPPGTDRIQFQYDDKGGTVKDQQFKILLSEVREIKADVKRVDKKVDDLSGRVDDLAEIVKKNHPDDF